MNELKVYYNGEFYGTIDHPDIIDEIEGEYCVNLRSEIRFEKGGNPEGEWQGFLDEYYGCVNRRTKCL